MRINLNFHLDFEGSRSLNLCNYNINPKIPNIDTEVAKLAYKRLWEIKREHGFRDMIIEKITYNEDIDITGIVQKMENAPIEMQMRLRKDWYK